MTAPARLSPQAIERLLRPRSVAIVGASASPGALGASVLANLERMRYPGEIHLINPKRGEIGGRPCLKSIDDLPMGVDAAVLAIPRAGVLDAVRALGARRAGSAIIFSSGFAEGGEAGRQEQREIARIAAEHDMVIEGPNCLGLVNHVDRVALTFVETPALPLDGQPCIAIVSQSGAMACVLAVMLQSRALPVSYSVSTGNEAASGVEDYVDYLLGDSSTRVIAMIVEQFRQPARFLELARRVRDAGKIIVLLHPGRSAAARASAATHTGALAGDYAVMRLKVEGEGVVLAESLEELGDILDMVHRCRVLPCGGTIVITESGAFKALTLDLAEQVDLPLPAIDDRTAPALRAAMPDFVPVSNPLDLTAQGLIDPEIYRRTLAAVSTDARLGTIILGIIQTDATTSNLKFPPILQAIRDLRPAKSVIFAGLDEGAQVPAHYVAALRELGVPYFTSPDRAMRAAARLIASTKRAAPAPPGSRPSSVRAAADLPPRAAEELPVGVIPEYRAKLYLTRFGLRFPVGRLVQTLEETEQAADAIGYPVVLKAQSVHLSHKSDAGGVVLGLSDRSSLIAGWRRLSDNLARSRPGLTLEGVLVERMGPPGVELLIGGRSDPEWGPVILVGFGGVQAELTQDVRLLRPGQDPSSIIEELYLLKSGALFKGYRGAPALDVTSIADLITRLGELLLAEPSIAEVDLNPVVAYPVGEGTIALDALMLTRPRLGDRPA
jgi:acyl-CoA synthetase (NDP forming)